MRKVIMSGVIATLAVGAAGLAALTPAFGHEGQMGAKMRGPLKNFEMLDADSDGKLTRAELEEHRAMEFEARDADGDGAISQQEMIDAMIERARARIEERAAQMFDRRDADGDGSLSLAEMQGGQQLDRMFERLDKDGDGAISMAELEEVRKMRGHRKGFGKRAPAGQ